MTPDCEPGDLDCAQALAELEGFLDGEIPAERIAEIREHITACYPCAERAEFESHLRELIRQRCAERAPDSLVLRIRACLADVHLERGSRPA